MEQIEKHSFPAAELIKTYPPQLRHPNKRLVYERARAANAPVAGEIVYARWGGNHLPYVIPARRSFTIQPGIYDYTAPHPVYTTAWQVNFADPALFCAYGSALLAQDELQVAEHPILGSLREALLAGGHPACTVERGQPTPVTVTGAHRLCILHIEPDPSAGRPNGLYGHNFSHAAPPQISAAVEPLNPPTQSNILAMAAPACGVGEYTPAQIKYILQTACLGFSAAQTESQRLAGPAAVSLIHTGFWGCGAYGGSRIMMILLQALAADLIGVDLVFYTVDEPGAATARQALDIYNRLCADDPSLAGMLASIQQLHLQWGFSNGT